MKKLLFCLPLILLLGSCSKEEVSQEYQSIEYNVYMGDNLAGFQTSTMDEEGNYRYVFEFNDRGRGPHLEEVIKLNTAGQIEKMHINGHNYLKDTVFESFISYEGTSTWKSTSESGSSPFDKNSFYSAVNGTFGSNELMIRTLLSAPDQTMNLLPSGEVSITGNDKIQVNADLSLKLIEVSGMSFNPSYVWMDTNDRLFASVSTWLTCIKSGYDSLTSQLLELQNERENKYYQTLAGQLTETPDGLIAIQNVNVFDAINGTLVENKTVIIEGNKIKSITAGNEAVPGEARIIDGINKTLLPGLFDMHTHYFKSAGILHIAAGVTSIRDLANSFDLPELKAEIDEEKVIGPRILIMAGFIDQAGPYAGPTGKIINNLEEGIEAVKFYNDRGYQQIKLYSSIDPAWVKPLAEKAHSYGMKVSGHIPAHMLARQAIEDGYDEIQHVNMLALNFLSDTIDTRTPLRFSMIGEHTHELDLDGEEFKSFIQLLKDKQIVVDPTVSIFEGMLTSKAGEASPQFEAIIDRLPVQVQRGFYSGGLPITKDKEERYKASYNKLLRIINALYISGVTIVAGTDAMAGFALHKELENYVKAGIPASAVLQIATINSAKVIGVENKLGSIEEGKIADLILIDGNPLEDITAIRRVELTIKDGKIYDAAALYRAIGIKHFK